MPSDPISPAKPLAISGKPPAPADPVKVRNAAREFESFLIAQMLKSARDSGSQGWMGTGDDQTGASAVEMAEQQFAQALSSAGGLGLARMVEASLNKAS
ncbi:MAG: hypothetical protein ACR2I2_15880 [Bryobacteraceae bacterium]